MKELKCPVCGEPTSVYMGNARKDGLCRAHAKQLKEGLLIYCEKCTSWHNPKEACIPKKQNISNMSCPICGKPANGKEVCKECYVEILDKQSDLDKNQKPWELKDYFYNLHSSIYRLRDKDYARGQIYKLYAIAWLIDDLYNDKQCSNVVTDYTRKIIEYQMKQSKEYKTNEAKEKAAKTIVAASNTKNRASDGHICKSASEVIIDDILYKAGVCHGCEIKVKEIPPYQNRVVVSDWFIPLQGLDGIYIEYWGMDKQDYQDNKEEKRALYQKYNVKLIEIDKNDIDDRQNLEYSLFTKLQALGWNSKN